MWALTVIPLSVVLLFRKKLPAYTLTFILIMGVVPVALMFAANMGAQAAPVFEPLFSALNGIANWMPSMVIAAFKLGAGAMFDPAQTLPLIGAVPTWLWGALAGLMWTAIGGGAFLLTAAFKLGAGAMFDPAQTLPLIGAVPTWLWGALAGLMWTAIGGGAFLLTASRRDV